MQRQKTQADTAVERRWKFLALSQGQARQRELKGDYLLISIQDPDEPQAELPQPPNCHAILRLQFDDIIRRDDGLTLFSREQALQVLGFVDNLRDEVSTIACHCKMGIRPMARHYSRTVKILPRS